MCGRGVFYLGRFFLEEEGGGEGGEFLFEAVVADLALDAFALGD